MIPYQNPLAMLSGAYPALPQFVQYTPAYDKRTDREKLDTKLLNNTIEIDRLQKENDEIREALKLIDEHPVIEKMNNLIKKLVG